MEITINDILYVVITIAIPLILRFIYQLVANKLAGTKYANAVTAIYNAVDCVNQTYVDTLKEHGSFDQESAAAALENAKTTALSLMEDSTRAWLEKTFSDVDGWLTTQIESAVKNRKAGVANG